MRRSSGIVLSAPIPGVTRNQEIATGILFVRAEGQDGWCEVAVVSKRAMVGATTADGIMELLDLWTRAHVERDRWYREMLAGTLA